MSRHAAVPIPDTPIVNPNEVKGFVGSHEIPPDRYFYLLNESDESLWQVDGYCVGDNWSINLICPVCGNNLRLDSTKKRFQVTEAGIETDEPIQCPYPGEFGGMCRFRVEFQLPRGEKFFDFRLADGSVKRLRVDALIRRA